MTKFFFRKGKMLKCVLKTYCIYELFWASYCVKKENHNTKVRNNELI